MARGINKVILIGNLGNDPETRYTAAGVAVTTISLATSDMRKDKETGDNKEYTEWHRVKFWNRLAEIAGEYLKKGSKVYIEGRLQTRKWEDQNGQERYTTEIIANEMQMLDNRGGAQDYDQAPSRSRPTAARSETSTSSSSKSAPPAFDDFDDDIPF